MTIEITQPETEKLIHDYLDSGEFSSVDELVITAMDALRAARPAANATPLTATERRKLEGRKSLVELFAESPFHGLSMDFDESEDAKDYGRELVL